MYQMPIEQQRDQKQATDAKKLVEKQSSMANYCNGYSSIPYCRYRWTSICSDDHGCIFSICRDYNYKTITNKIAAILVDHILRRGIPTTIMTDSGTNLISNIMNTVYERLEITKLTSSPSHQQSNGCIERAIGSIKHILRKLITHSNYKTME